MSYPIDRRLNERRTGDDLPPEFVAVLRLCGGEVRLSDLDEPAAALEQRRNDRRGAAPPEAVGRSAQR